MRRTLTIGFGLMLGLVIWVAVYRRQNQIVELRADRSHVLARLAVPAGESSGATRASLAEANDSASAPSVELLRLRAEVTKLGNRKRELASTRAESDRLRAQLSTRGTNAPGAVALPVGYIRKSEAKFVGYTTPEDTLQSFFWAVHNRDAARLFEAMSPEIAESFQKTFQEDQSAEKFFDDFNVMPGFHVMERNVEDENSVVLQVQTVPDHLDFLQTIKFKRVSGQWKLKDF